MQQDHIRGGETDDHSELSIVFLPNGSPYSIHTTWDTGGDGDIPDSWVNAAAITAAVVMGLGAGIQAGLSTAAVEEVAEVPVEVGSGGTAIIPAQVIDAASAIGAGTVAAISAGSIAYTGVVAAASVYNFFAEHIVALSDDGGRLNFTAVIAHNINKLIASVEP